MADITIKYKNNTIAELNESGTKTLNTNGKYCEGDITIQYSKTEQSSTSIFKRWDVTVTNGLPASGTTITLVQGDEWLKENRENPNLCISVIPKFTIQGDGNIQGVYLNTNMALIRSADNLDHHGISAYKHTNGGITVRARKPSLVNASTQGDIGDIILSPYGSLSIIAYSGYPLAVGDYVVIAFIA